jgi:hypothetical protein
METQSIAGAALRKHNRIARCIVRLNFRMAAVFLWGRMVSCAPIGNRRKLGRLTIVFLLGPALSPAATLSQPAKHAFEAYVASLEIRLARQHTAPDAYAAVAAPDAGARTNTMRELRAGALRVDPVNGGSWQVSGGFLHHWRAAALVPGASARDMLALLRDYNHLASYYAPEVVSSRALTGDGKRAIVAMRFRKQQVVTVVLDAEFETQSGLVAETRGYSFSRSMHIWQIDQPGSDRERRLPEGSGDGFLWQLNSYWSFAEQPDGLIVECEAVSLTRDVPAGLGWLILPIIESLPRASLEFTLTATRNALLANAGKREGEAPR